jgi:hypothetical protein
MKKINLFFIIFITIIFIFGQLVYAANWEINKEYQEYDSKEYEVFNNNKNLMFANIAIKKNNVSLNENIITGYSYINVPDLTKYSKENNLNLKEKNKKLYPIEFARIVYSGYDKSGNIYLKVYKSAMNENEMNSLYSDINSYTKSLNNEEVERFYPLLINLIEVKSSNSTDIIIDPSKIIKFKNYLIPSFKVKTNNYDSNIQIEIIK